RDRVDRRVRRGSRDDRGPPAASDAACLQGRARGRDRRADERRVLVLEPAQHPVPPRRAGARPPTVGRRRSRDGRAFRRPVERRVTVATMTAIRPFVTQVAATRHLTPRMIQVTLQGGALETYRPGRPDQFVYVLLPPPERTDLTVDGSFTWEAYDEMPPS